MERRTYLGCATQAIATSFPPSMLGHFYVLTTRPNCFCLLFERHLHQFSVSRWIGHQSGAVKGGGNRDSNGHCSPAAQKKKVSAALVFGDMVRAYYSALLELMLGPLLTEGEREVIIFAGLTMRELRNTRSKRILQLVAVCLVTYLCQAT